jgi:pilus assembly protein CpaC
MFNDPAPSTWSRAVWLTGLAGVLGLLNLCVGTPLYAQESEMPKIESQKQGTQDRDVRALNLSVGEQTSISASNVRSYSEGISGIVDVRLPKDGSQFVIVALRAGETTLLLIMMDGRQVQYRIRVTAKRSEGAQAVQAIDNIRLDFYFVQLNQSYGHQLGVGWPGTIGGSFNFAASIDLMAGQLQNATAVIANQVLPRLDIAQNSGWARLLRQAAVITANGNEANFASGGEVNIPIQGALTAEVRRIQYGNVIQVLPRYDADTGRIELKLHAEVSDLTQASSEFNIPGRTTSTLETIVNLELGQSLVLAGLSSKTETRNTAGLPGLSQIPILGALFGSHGQRNENVENLIFIVPTVVDAVSLRARNRVTEALRVYDDYSGDTDSNHLIGVPNTDTQPLHRRPGYSARAR